MQTSDIPQFRGVLSVDDFRAPSRPVTAAYTSEEFAQFAGWYLRYEANARDAEARIELASRVAVGACWEKSGPVMHRTLLAYDVAVLTPEGLRERAQRRGDTLAVAAHRMTRVQSWWLPASAFGTAAWANVAAAAGMRSSELAPLHELFESAYVDELVTMVKGEHRK